MADRALRGMGLGSKSFEDEEGVEMAERQEIGFDCPNGHHFDITFSVEAELPGVCGAESHRSDGTQAEKKKEKPQRTHWDMLTERRSIPELEELLKERLDDIRKD